jgi:hypothetical protein
MLNDFDTRNLKEDLLLLEKRAGDPKKLEKVSEHLRVPRL